MSTFRVAVITGGASGMGLAVAEALLGRQGWHMYMLDRNPQAFEKLRSEVKAATNFRQVDVIDYDDLASVFHEIYTSEGQIDFVFANAGVGGSLDHYQAHSTTPPPKPNINIIDVNLSGVCYTTYLATHYFKLSKVEDASVVITTSNSAFYPATINPLYTASKHGVLGLMRSIAPILINDKIRVNAICPGPVPTPLLLSDVLPILPKEIITPLSNIVTAVLALLDGKEMINSVGPRVSGDKLYGQAVELSDRGLRAPITVGMLHLTMFSVYFQNIMPLSNSRFMGQDGKIVSSRIWV